MQDRDGGYPPVGRDDARLRRPGQPGGLVRAGGRSRAARAVPGPAQHPGAGEGRRGCCEGEDAGHPAGGWQADPHGGREGADHGRPAAAHAGYDLVPADADRASPQDELAALVARCRMSLGTDRRYLLEQFEVAEIARKAVGVGSVGTC